MNAHRSVDSYSSEISKVAYTNDGETDKFGLKSQKKCIFILLFLLRVSPLLLFFFFFLSKFGT